MNNPFDYIPEAVCNEAYQKLIVKLESFKKSSQADDIRFCRELEEGKMLGVLVATDNNGSTHILYAFSGQLGCCGFYRDGFVGPVFDYLQPDGYFKTKERDISRQSADISLFENGTLRRIKDEYSLAEAKLNNEISQYKEQCRVSKLARDAKRESGNCSAAETAAMIRQSQFEKAELRRLKNRLNVELAPFAAKLDQALSELETMKEKRRADSEALQQWLFSNFKLLNGRGETKSLSEIFASTPMKVPPSGAGECCAPKLLQEVYRRGWHPVAMAEYWHGKPKGGEVRIEGEHYPACRGKCLPVLGWMLQGLDVEPPLSHDCRPTTTPEPEIIFENQWFCVVNKPGGMLSVPGKGAAVSVEQWLAARYGADRLVKMAHRLDQDTSGLLVATFGQYSFKVMQSLFATRKVEKTYIADLEGDYCALGIARQGHISLPLAPDWLDRPRQRVDFTQGKTAVSDYEFKGTAAGRSRIIFHPLTGRTHQLRVHAASEFGLGMPIAGDRLYGKSAVNPSGRLMLHAQKLEFTFPIDGQHYHFESPVPF